ncbi:hypothetical protein M3Y99_00493800 [Aphelenchoides fujianensis]|nr:hypothetical protein M3Y99_00493800 [Aphelenchoides fujianensis]
MRPKSASLNCKFKQELKIFSDKDAKWSCHFDDDQYVNVGQLRRVLDGYQARVPMYVGRQSIAGAVHIANESFRFATGGAGVCISRPLLRMIRPHIDRFPHLSPNFGGPGRRDVGYLVDKLDVMLTVNTKFHSHLETVMPANLSEQVSLSPALGQTEFLFSPTANHHTLYSLHCFLRPEKCKKMAAKLQAHRTSRPDW